MREIPNLREFMEVIGGNKVAIIDFFATWCGPCRMAAPIFEGMSQEEAFSGILFAKVDCDKSQDISKQEAIRSLPTFKVYVDGKCVETLTGFHQERLRTILQQYAPLPQLPDSFRLLALTSANKEEFLTAKTLLLRMVDNIIQNPLQEKFRSIRVENPQIMEKLLPVPGAMETFFDLGFVENTDRFTMPANQDLIKLNRMRNQLASLEYGKDGTSAPTTQKSTTTANKVCHGTPPKPTFKSSPGEVAAFVMPVESRSNSMRKYELARSLDEARRVMDLPARIAAAKQASGSQPSTDTTLKSEDFPHLLLELLRWFKQDFFTWMDKPTCTICQENSHVQSLRVENAPPGYEGEAGRIEVYQCAASCHVSSGQGPVLRFPRYNCPRKLLSSRTGRCGEWANCFCLCLVAAGFPRVRIVDDSTDHVWCEVWIQPPGETHCRWVHCDPCEQKADTPLLYERGWGKKLSYCIAHEVGSRLIQDVTWRYSVANKFEEVFERRRSIDEKSLTTFILQHNTHRLNDPSLHNAAGERMSRDQWLSTICHELVEFLVLPIHTSRHRQANTADSEGRTTGSLEWRLARGELGGGSVNPDGDKSVTQEALRLTSTEESALEFHINYNCAKDEYYRGPVISNRAALEPLKPGASISKGWASLMTRYHNLSRKVENDWHMAYLARMPDTKPEAAQRKGEAEWTLDLTGTGLAVKEMKLMFTFAQFESGNVRVTLCTYGSSKENGEPQPLTCMPVRGFMSLSEADLNNNDPNVHVVRMVLHVELSGGEGDCAWQKAQLFRQKDQDLVNSPFEWIVSLRKVE